MNSEQQTIAERISKYIPAEFADIFVDLYFSSRLTFKIVRGRKTKLGDFRAPSHPSDKPVITVNGDSNPYQFLITTVHEFAHLHTYLEHGWKVKPHGIEWQQNYRKLLRPVLERQALPEDVQNALIQSLINVKASSCSDTNLARVLKRYDKNSAEHVLLEELPENARFELRNRVFIKGKVRRKRYVCIEERSKKNYLIHALAEIKPL